MRVYIYIIKPFHANVVFFVEALLSLSISSPEKQMARIMHIKMMIARQAEGKENTVGERRSRQ